jgi:TPR repeat protein
MLALTSSLAITLRSSRPAGLNLLKPSKTKANISTTFTLLPPSSSQVLGFLIFDGEGTKADPNEAVRLFKVAKACGSVEGEKALGWMYNTGQY